MAKIHELDDLDRQILSILMTDAKMAYTDIAKQLQVSGGTVHVRMKKLEEVGIVKGARLEVDEAKLGYDIISFIGIFLEKSSLYEDVIRQINQIPEVVNAYYTTGNYSIFTKIICKDTDDLRKLLSEKIQAISGIQRTETLIALEERIDRPISLDVKNTQDR
ncbi:Lrp/AsnC ligand binding domain-containing protein [Membranicola marinus]|uniref:Lrp/AsnC ligand binding domain-containing protein n=1 Tax=Membranihabitans marinus TaxID=1227546 RepID=A0A953HMX0_9BACT|nr:Lrp/AsnC ligand binding domain-containing protein [Membranihabitans marinus]MBY5957473.1 Lrp/AsnC ligand binding domain-containing protein [Membranihabitans marinus]